jgi:hypothetical protein
VPQLLLSGTVVPFDYLNPTISSREHVPLVGNMMTSRWTFEALAVEQFSNNKYEKEFFPIEKEISNYKYITAFVIPTLKSELDECSRNIFKKENPEITINKFAILNNEIPLLQKGANFGPFAMMKNLTPALLDDSTINSAKSYLDSLSRFYSTKMTRLTSKTDAIYERLKQQLGEEGVYSFKQAYYNENIANLVKNVAVENKIIEGEGKLIRKYEPVFMDSDSHCGNAHFYAPVKEIGNWKLETFWFNFMVIWLMSLVLYITLLHDTLRKVIEYLGEMRFGRKG